MLPLPGIEPRPFQPVAYSLYRLSYRSCSFLMLMYVFGGFIKSHFRSQTARLSALNLLLLPGIEPRPFQPVAYSLYRLSYRSCSFRTLMYVFGGFIKSRFCSQTTRLSALTLLAVIKFHAGPCNMLGLMKRSKMGRAIFIKVN